MRRLGVALALVGTLACNTTVYSVVDEAAPSITFFAASPGTITQGAATALSWRVSKASSIAIDNGVGDVTGQSAVSVSPTATTTYTLTATGRGGTRTQTVQVTVTAPMGVPSISAFTATPDTVTAGGSSQLAWSVSGATSITIDNGVGDVTGRNSASVSPTATTTYKLTAAGPGGNATAQVTVTVSAQAAPVISSFTASPASINAGGSSQLAWSVSGATSLSIDGGVGDVTGRSSASVSPTATTTYTLTATGAGGTRTATATVTVTSASAPVIASFTASPASISAGGSSQLAWSVSNATSVSIDNGVGDVTTRSSASVSPTATTLYTLTATGAGGTKTATATVTVTSGGSADATLVVDTSQGRSAISPYVYGYNPPEAGKATWTPGSSSAPAGTTIWREGGNRTTAYNWTNNYSNCGADCNGAFYNDTYMGSPTEGTGHAVIPIIDYAKAHGIAALVTVPIQGWVAKDGSGSVSLTSVLTDRFVASKPRKGSAFTTSPSPTSSEVYQDELAAFIAQRVGSGGEIHISIDNEPDLWFGTHKEIERTQTTYQSYLDRYVASAAAIRDAVPGAILYGPASYGWTGYVSFQNAPDAPRDAQGNVVATIDDSFLDWFLVHVKDASTTAGKRLLDVLDLHYYSEAQSSGCANSGDNGVRVFSDKPANNDCLVAARVQAARSFGDPAYIETSWITQWMSSSLGKGIQLVPRMKAKIAARYPGTKLSLSEYNFGGGDHISGAIAEAEALGILGRDGAYAAMVWEAGADSSFIRGAFQHYRNYDGAGKSFGDTSVSATSSDQDHVGVYASVDAASDGRLVLVIVHRPTLSNGSLDLKARTVKIQWTHSRALTKARTWQTTSSSATPQSISAPTVSGSSVTLTLPGMSVTTVELTP
jgi:PKD repeat protein